MSGFWSSQNILECQKKENQLFSWWYVGFRRCSFSCSSPSCSSPCSSPFSHAAITRLAAICLLGRVLTVTFLHRLPGAWIEKLILDQPEQHLIRLSEFKFFKCFFLWNLRFKHLNASLEWLEGSDPGGCAADRGWDQCQRSGLVSLLLPSWPGSPGADWLKCMHDGQLDSSSSRFDSFLKTMEGDLWLGLGWGSSLPPSPLLLIVLLGGLFCRMTGRMFEYTNVG